MKSAKDLYIELCQGEDLTEEEKEALLQQLVEEEWEVQQARAILQEEMADDEREREGGLK